ncbi:MAG: Type I restriction-modification system protein [Candidatus Moranbacteria bacterium GW2011_GWF1_34_10]|nr:MAG: Type I restriction-modification system protein [Candidatus Moranbacteria bacterium GW2011_GWF1_34_10]
MKKNDINEKSNSISKAGLIWNIAELLRGSWKQYEYQDVVLPLVVLKRLDSILIDTKTKVLEQYNQFKGKVDVDPVLKAATKTGFYNISQYDLKKLLEDPKHISKNLRNYIHGFSDNIQEIIAKFDFEKQIDRLEGGNLLFLILKELDKVDLHPRTTSNHDMGYIFEELIRRFSEQSNETAGEHYTPREVIEMMVEVLFSPDKEVLKKKHIIKTVYDCACGTGGMLSTSKEHILKTINPDADIYLFGQELNPATYAICKSDILIKGDEADNIKGGDKDHSKASTLSNDQFLSEHFDYLLTNPPFGVDWKKDKEAVTREAERGFAGRFGAGLPRISDGQFLFLQHMISKMRNESEGGSRLAIVFNGSPLFTGDAGSGESEIRRWILEHDWLEAIVALPDQLFYNTGINTYVWFLTNRKVKERKGKVQLIDARTFSKKMRKSLGSKRNEISSEGRNHILKIYESFGNSEYSKIFNTTDFAYRQLIIERPLRLNFQVSSERIEKLKETAAFNKADEKTQKMVLDILENFPNKKMFKNREKFLELLRNQFAMKIMPVQLLKAIKDSLSERDETADICTDKNGNPESDSELRDSENVPYHQDVYEYFEKEVKPFVADAWINENVVDVKDGKIGKVGYEIPLTRYFYKYQPPRALEEIESDIEEVENELLELLKKL